MTLHEVNPRSYELEPLRLSYFKLLTGLGFLATVPGTEGIATPHDTNSVSWGRVAVTDLLNQFPCPDVLRLRPKG